MVAIKISSPQGRVSAIQWPDSGIKFSEYCQNHERFLVGSMGLLESARANP